MAIVLVTKKLHAVRSAKLSLDLTQFDFSAVFDMVNHKTLSKPIKLAMSDQTMHGLPHT